MGSFYCLKKRMVLLIYISCSLTSVVCVGKNIHLNWSRFRSCSRLKKYQEPEPLGKKIKSRSRLEKNEEPESEPQKYHAAPCVHYIYYFLFHYLFKILIRKIIVCEYSLMSFYLLMRLLCILRQALPWRWRRSRRSPPRARWGTTGTGTH